MHGNEVHGTQIINKYCIFEVEKTFPVCIMKRAISSHFIATLEGFICFCIDVAVY